MLKQFNYDNDLVGGAFMVRESRISADLLLKQAPPEQWHQAIHVDNLLQKRKTSSAQRNSIAIRRRLEGLHEEFWLMLRDGDANLATQVSFCAALNRNLLLLEFMETVVKDAYLIQATTLERYTWLDFLEERSNIGANIATWKESSRKKMGQVVFLMLSEVGYLQNTRNRQLQRVLLRPELEILLEQHGKQRLQDGMYVSMQ